MLHPLWLQCGHEAAAPALRRGTGSSSRPEVLVGPTRLREEEGWKSGGLYFRYTSPPCP